MARRISCRYSRVFLVGLCLNLAFVTGCTAQQWQTTQAAFAATAIVGLAVIAESHAAYPVTTCESRCTLWGCRSVCWTR